MVMRGVLVDFDWSEIIFDLRRAGVGQVEIARQLGSIDEKMVRKYMSGSSPSHWRGELLLGLWEKHTGLDRQSAPRCPAALPRSTAPTRKRQREVSHMPTEHLPAVAQAYGITVPALIQMLSKKKPQGQINQCSGTLTLPGFEE